MKLTTEIEQFLNDGVKAKFFGNYADCLNQCYWLQGDEIRHCHNESFDFEQYGEAEVTSQVLEEFDKMLVAFVRGQVASMLNNRKVPSARTVRKWESEGFKTLAAHVEGHVHYWAAKLNDN